MLDVCLLGSGGSLPTPHRSLSALYINYKGHKILVDCGEGTQVSMKIAKSGFKNIDVICITHEHADHVLGLPGLLLTMANSGKINPVIIIGPIGIKNIVESLSVLCPILPYTVEFIECGTCSNIINLDGLYISSLSVEHTVSCNAFSFYAERKKKFDINKAIKRNIPQFLWGELQKGKDVNWKGKKYTSEMVLGDKRQGIKLSYCTDTRPIPTIVPFVENSDLLICEGMYGKDEDLEKALMNKHMLFSEAANIAKEAKVKELWLTHFSPSINSPEEFIDNARKIFSSTIIAEDRMKTTLKFI